MAPFPSFMPRDRRQRANRGPLPQPGQHRPAGAVVVPGPDTGAVAYLHTTAKVGQEAEQIIVRTSGRQTYGKGEQLRVTVRPDAVHLFSAKSGARLPADEAPA